MKLQFLLLAFFIEAILFMQKVSAQSWWDMDPHEVREKINRRIFNIPSEPCHVWSVVDQMIEQENRTTPIRIYIPSEENDLPIILLIHGGAWVAGNIDTHDNLARYLCSRTNAIVLSVGYLNAPEGKFPLPLEQCYDSLIWISRHAKEFSGNPSKIAVVGDSAGGNMTAALCLMARDRKGPKIDLQVLINPAPDLTVDDVKRTDGIIPLRWQAIQYLSDLKEMHNSYVSPLLAKDLHGLPPAVVILAEKDDLRDAGQQYANRLLSEGVPTQVYCQKGIGHLAGDAARASPRAQESLKIAVNSIHNVLTKK